jgi:3D (Asp-Asp-Asp) domain-containing protein
MVGESEFIEQSTTQPIVEEIEPTETIETTTEKVVESTTQKSIEPKYITFRVTAYCACSKCCGKYALNRPLDENGNEIVVGAANKRLTSGVSCASTLPFGTKINLDGYGTVVVQDRTAQWVVDKYGENIIDIYFDDHQVASNFECHYMKGVVV